LNDSGDLIVSTLRKIIRAVDLHSKSLTKKYGLTGPQLLVLKQIYDQKHITLGQLAKEISLSQATVTSILDRLEKLDFVIRVRNASDKRIVNIELCEKAVKILESKPNLLQEEFIQQFSNLDDWEQTLLISSLQRIATMMNAESIDSPPVLVSGPLNAAANEVNDFLAD
jgi:DNA-binding MarR family transcriptional regulator